MQQNAKRTQFADNIHEFKNLNDLIKKKKKKDLMVLCIVCERLGPYGVCVIYTPYECPQSD